MDVLQDGLIYRNADMFSFFAYANQLTAICKEDL